MVDYNENERNIIDHFKAFKPKTDLKATKYEQYLSIIPKEYKKYKCHTCYSILHDSDIIDGKCPCGEPHIQEMCILDHNGCGHPITEGIHICPICDEPVCGVCGDHSVFVVSRVTGYLSNIDSWNQGKRAELIDRVRTDGNNIINAI